MESRNPARLEDLVCEAWLGDADVFADACRAARSAQREWAAVPAPVRGKAIQAIGRLVEDNKEALARLVTREVGKPYPESLGEVQEIIDTCDFFLEGRRSTARPCPARCPTSSVHLPQPVGGGAIITAGNFPGPFRPGTCPACCVATRSSGSRRSTRPRWAIRWRGCS